MTLERVQKAHCLLSELHDLLERHAENNWIKGIASALREASKLSDDGFENARSVYVSMTRGGRGFSEYYIHADDPATRRKLNQPLDKIRDELWSIFKC